MAYQITDKTKKQSTKCPYNFECLSNDDWNTCIIERELYSNGLDIKNKANKAFCPYSMSFGFSMYVCQCPTRYEIYNRYNK